MADNVYSNSTTSDTYGYDESDMNGGGEQDLSGQIEGLMTMINKTSESITLQVSQVNDKVDSNTSSIQINANNIALKVSSSDYNGNEIASLINQTATTISIEGSKINLVGAVTVLSDIAGDLGTITAGSINISTDITVGDTINVGSLTSGATKSIIFANNTYIQAPNNGLYLQADASDYIGIHPATIDLYTSGYALSVKTGDTAGHMFIQAGLSGIQMLGSSSAGIQARNSANTDYAPMYATAFNVNSVRTAKKNIVPFTTDASNLIQTTPIYNFNYVNESDKDFPHTGVMLDDSPVWIADITGQGVDTYAMCSLSWKAIQEILTRVSALETKVG